MASCRSVTCITLIQGAAALQAGLERIAGGEIGQDLRDRTGRERTSEESLNIGLW